jgi:hypothetical protein
VLSLPLLAVLSAAPMADVWPYAGRRLNDGTLEYSYDLSLVKASGGTADAKEVWGDVAVAEFLKALPKEVRVRVAPGSAINITAGRPLEPTPLAVNFALSPDGPLAFDNPLGLKASNKLRPLLAPEQPKVLVGVEMMLWEARSLEATSLAAAEVDTEWMRRELWGKLAEQAVAIGKGRVGDGREGALALAARLLAANACLDPGRVPAFVHANDELEIATQGEIQRLMADPDAALPPAPWVWNPELTCGWIRARALAQPFDASRAGTVAVLTFVELLEKDGKLKAFWERVRQRRDRFVGQPAEERIVEWQRRVKGNLEKIYENLDQFIETLPVKERVPPGLMGFSQTPYERFLHELDGPERTAAWDELSAAVQDGRVKTEASGPWSTIRERALSSVVAVDAQKDVLFESSWRDRLATAFTALQGAYHEVREGGREQAPRSDEQERSDLRLSLEVPPMLEVEPLPLAFDNQAASLERLAAAITQENLQGLRGFFPDGRRGSEPILAGVAHLVPILRGLARLADGKNLDGKDAQEARRFISTWRSESGLTRDVREAFAAPFTYNDERQHTAIAGVSRREMVVGFSSPPKVELVGDPKYFTPILEAEQRYLVPVLVTVPAKASAQTRPLERQQVKDAIDAAERNPQKVDGAFIEALHAPAPVP